MHMDFHIWFDVNSKTWKIAREVWKGGSWGSDYIKIGFEYKTKKQAQDFVELYKKSERLS